MQETSENRLNKNDILPTHLQKSINNVIKKEGYTTYEMKVKPVPAKSGNYLGELYEVNIKGSTAEGAKESYIFIKRLLPVCEISVISLHDLYSRESFIYNELYDIYKYLQDEANVPKDERYSMVKGYGEHNPEAIIMENVAVQGYKTLDRMKVCPLKFTEVCIQQLARFHGLSFVLQNKRPDYYQKYIKTWKCPYIYNDEWNRLMENTYKDALNQLDGEAREKFESLIDINKEKYKQYLQEDKWTIQCLNHGDYRHPNILTKQINGDFKDVFVLDYQFLFHSTPVYDFLFFIFTATDRKFRKEHLTHLKQLYFDSLGKFLLFFNMDVEDVCPRKEFERTYTECLDLGLMISLLMLRLTLIPEDNVPELGSDITNWEFKLDDNYGDRIRGIIDDFIEWGYL